MNLLLGFVGINFTDGSDLLSGQEDADLVAEKVEEMWINNSRVLWIELLNELVKGIEILNSLTEHLLLYLVVNLVRLILPIHLYAYFKNQVIYVYKFE